MLVTTWSTMVVGMTKVKPKYCVEYVLMAAWIWWRNLLKYTVVIQVISIIHTSFDVIEYRRTWLSSGPGCQAVVGCEAPTCLLSKIILSKVHMKFISNYKAICDVMNLIGVVNFCKRPWMWSAQLAALFPISIGAWQQGSTVPFYLMPTNTVEMVTVNMLEFISHWMKWIKCWKRSWILYNYYWAEVIDYVLVARVSFFKFLGVCVRYYDCV